MNSDLYFDGNTYISAKRAAKISGYVNDYIGQLCRDGKLEAKMVGRSWYVSLESLIAHKNAFVSGTKSKPTFFYKNITLLPALPQYEIASQKSSDVSSRNESLKTPLLLLPAPQAEIPVASVSVSQEKSYALHPFQMQFSKAVAFVFAMILSVSAFQSMLSLQPTTKDIYATSFNKIEQTLVSTLQYSEMQLSANVFSSAKNSLDFIARNVYLSVHGVWVNTKHTIILAIGGEVEEETKAPVVASLPRKGVVVIPTDKVSDQEKTIADIKRTFSDEVSVQQKDDGSGVITPVFKETKGDDYLYVLVPISN